MRKSLVWLWFWYSRDVVLRVGNRRNIINLTKSYHNISLLSKTGVSILRFPTCSTTPLETSKPWEKVWFDYSREVKMVWFWYSRDVVLRVGNRRNIINWTESRPVFSLLSGTCVLILRTRAQNSDSKAYPQYGSNMPSALGLVYGIISIVRCPKPMTSLRSNPILKLIAPRCFIRLRHVIQFNLQIGTVISPEFLCQLHSEVSAVANQWMHEWTRTVLEFTQLRQMREFSAIAEDFTLTLASRGSRKREMSLKHVQCALCIVQLRWMRRCWCVEFFLERNSSRKLLDSTLVQVHSIVMQYAVDMFLDWQVNRKTLL